MYFIQDVDSLCSKVKTCQPEEEEIEKVTAEEQENLVFKFPICPDKQLF